MSEKHGSMIRYHFTRADENNGMRYLIKCSRIRYSQMDCKTDLVHISGKKTE